jgi:hypothetical protein
MHRMYGAKSFVQFVFQNTEDQDVETMVPWKVKPLAV